MGKPEPPTREQTQALLKEARATRKESVNASREGVLDIKRTVAPWSLLLITEQGPVSK
jgi:hypothetical protein